jgi:hypothetical protein
MIPIGNIMIKPIKGPFMGFILDPTRRKGSPSFFEISGNADFLLRVLRIPLSKESSLSWILQAQLSQLREFFLNAPCLRQAPTSMENYK